MSVAMADTVRRLPVRQDDLVIWVLAAVTWVVVLLLYRHMLRGVTVVVPARTHLAGWRSLGIADGADRWLFLVFTFSFIGLLALSLAVAVVWLLVVLGGVEMLRRAHNVGLPAGAD